MNPLVMAMAVVPLVAACAPATAGGGPAAGGAIPSAGDPRPVESTAQSPVESPVETATGRSPATGGAPTAKRAPKPKVPRGTTAGYVVFDRTTGKVTVQREAHRRFRSASVVKILIAIDLLESRETVTRGDRALLSGMLRASDDDAATIFWRRGGERRIIQRMVKRAGLKDTLPPPADKPGFWGYTSISASDIATTYRYLLERAEPRVSSLILGHLRKAAKCGADGFDQSFGIPSAVPRPFAVKQGWSGFGTVPPVRCVSGTAGAPAGGVPLGGDASSIVPAAAPAAGLGPIVVPDLGRPVLHTTGLAGKQERLIMVLLTAHPSGTSWRESVRRTTSLAGQIYRAGSPPSR
ncbi:hypothetical protein [Spongiactinospora sp. TRM90649]|uniref:hypothetical protein n=1 Tax=Spongiactinospora sp. TRM90649 TaxID=3031114 RepID=UPI0023F889E6|nr:hypothetical protein [Spongiactinospora sp. TRM90649]MDF5752212.1 hypothetical protein [Spongiactinospora sp. TRM90649]